MQQRRVAVQGRDEVFKNAHLSISNDCASLSVLMFAAHAKKQKLKVKTDRVKTV